MDAKEFVKELFKELYEVMQSEGAEPECMCYAATSVENDLIAIIDGRLGSGQLPNQIKDNLTVNVVINRS